MRAPPLLPPPLQLMVRLLPLQVLLVLLFGIIADRHRLLWVLQMLVGLLPLAVLQRLLGIPVELLLLLLLLLELLMVPSLEMGVRMVLLVVLPVV